MPVATTHTSRERLGGPGEIAPEVMEGVSGWAQLGGKGSPSAAPAPDGEKGGREAVHAAGSAGTSFSGENGVVVKNLTFSYQTVDGRPVAGPPQINDVSFALPVGSCTLLIGANGAGKTTLLKVLGGQSMVPKDAVRVLGLPPFHTTSLISDGVLSYIGGTWSQVRGLPADVIARTPSVPSSAATCLTPRKYLCVSICACSIDRNRNARVPA